ncbi:MAG TPA: archease [Dissulfurispiraceae bacterium]|nr:archease [Dissulfurispiraceae bacterium]
MEAFSIIDVSGDVGIAASGATLGELFANAGASLYHLMTDVSGVRALSSRKFSIEADTCDGLLVCFLNELIFLFETEELAGSRIEITSLDEAACSLTCVIWGERFVQGLHEKRLLVKAATYHKLLMEQREGLWYAEVIFDI